VVVPAPLNGEEIPLARRRQPPQPPRPSLLGRLLRLLLVTGLVTGTVLLLMAGPLRRWLTQPPVAGLNARLSADGRLLGHFPYPELNQAQLVAIGADLRLQPDAAQALLAMQRAAKAEGVDLVVLSAFRSITLQRQLFFDVKAERNQSARDRARVSAPPGFSEHSTGFAVDLGDGHQPGTNLSIRFDHTPAYQWLSTHAHRFHFQLSFPAGNVQGVSYEPWHWRFEGSTEALRLFEPAQRLAR